MTHCDPANAAPYDETFVPTISDVIGVGESAHRLVRVGDWTFTAWMRDGGDEPMIRDVDLAARLGFDRPRKIRDLIRRVWPENKRPQSRPVMGRQRTRNGGEREFAVDEFWLTEAQALKVVMRADTETANDLQDVMIDVFRAAMRGLLRPVSVAPIAPAIPAEVLAALAVVPVLTAQMETITAMMKDSAARIGALEQNLASGIVGPERGSEITKRLYAASLRATCGDKTRAKSVRGRWVQTLRNATQFNGPRSAWRNLPRAALAVVESHLDAIEREADLMSKTGPIAAQPRLPFSAN
jgi:hypothetical protein